MTPGPEVGEPGEVFLCENCGGYWLYKDQSENEDYCKYCWQRSKAADNQSEESDEGD